MLLGIFWTYGTRRGIEYRRAPVLGAREITGPPGAVLELVVPLLRILAALVLVALNGLFVAAEFAFVRIRATQIDRLVEEGRATAGMVREARRKLDQYLAVCQLGITISSLGLGALAEPVVDALLVRPLFELFGLPEGWSHTLAFPLAFGIVSFAHVVFGELAPKTVAIQSPERTSLFVAPFMRFFYYLLLPFTIVFNGTANAITRALGYPPASESDETYSEGEIRQLVAQSTRHGTLEEDEEEMVDAVFELNDTVAREIMVPRPDVVTLPADLPLRKLVSVAAAGNYTRYPIYEGETPDRIIGAVHIKDVLRAVEAEGGLDAHLTARDLMREVLVVPENRPLDGILEDFQKQELQMAIVIDEWGSFEGLFTLEDIIEEIVGEIRDEFDEEEPAVHRLPDGSYSIDGRIPIGVVNEALGSSFESEDFDTIGGLVLGRLGRVPEVGDEIRLDGYLLRVDEVDGPRVAQVVAREAPEEADDEEQVDPEG
ncbi:MAG TPA: hemolysin family protein [Rubrobacteraceae bacterium]|nr:hemolysin family protein [Rubrobacteraceae bacterium]